MTDSLSLHLGGSDGSLTAEAVLRFLQNQTPIRIYIKNRDLQFVFATRETAEVHGLELEELLGLTDRDLFERDLADRFIEIDRRVLESGIWRMLREEETHPDGRSLVIESYKIPLFADPEARKDVVGLLGITTDITARHRERERLLKEAHTDPLTGLANRRAAKKYFQQRLKEAKRYDHPLQILLLDVDDFKAVNDHHGHAAGDEVLRQYAHRLQTQLRESDHVSRWGGDELLIISPERDDMQLFEERLARILEEPIEFISGLKRRITCSIGSAAFPDDGQTLESLSRTADSALYRAKGESRADSNSPDDKIT